MKVFLFVLLFFVCGALFIISNNNIYFFEEQGAGLFYEEYVSWLDNLYSNFRILTGNVVEMKWFSN